MGDMVHVMGESLKQARSELRSSARQIDELMLSRLTDRELKRAYRSECFPARNQSRANLIDAICASREDRRELRLRCEYHERQAKKLRAMAMQCEKRAIRAELELGRLLRTIERDDVEKGGGTIG